MGAEEEKINQEDVGMNFEKEVEEEEEAEEEEEKDEKSGKQM
jgi:hypothetical protein